MKIADLKNRCTLAGGCRSPIFQCDNCPYRTDSNVLQLAAFRNPGNGAREKVEEYFALFPKDSPIGDIIRADHFLLWMWSEGYKIVSLDLAD